MISRVKKTKFSEMEVICGMNLYCYCCFWFVFYAIDAAAAFDAVGFMCPNVF